MKKLILALTMLTLPLTTAFAENVTPPVKKIELNKKNTLVLRGPITSSSVSPVQLKALELSQRLDDDEVIYLVLATPGGSVSAGEMLITTLKALPQKVETIVIFAASMGFQITQALGTRNILDNGVLMSHRATVSLQGQIDGEIETRLSFYKANVDAIETDAAKRVSLSLTDYKAKIVNEWWTFGNKAVEENAADHIVDVSCSKELVKSRDIITIRGFFGGFSSYIFSSCPLIPAPLPNNNSYIAEPIDDLDLWFNNPTGFVNKYHDDYGFIFE